MEKPDKTSEQIELLHSRVKEYLNKNYSEEEIIEQLNKDGIEPHYTRLVFENIHDDRSDSKNFRNSIILGCFFIAGGLLINIFSYRIAVNSNSSFFYVFWGIVVFGITTIIRGFILYRK